MNRTTEAQKMSYGSDFSEATLFDMIGRLRKTDNMLFICMMTEYPDAKAIIAKYPELNIRVIGVPSIPGNTEYASLLIDLNDLIAVHNHGA